MATVLLTLPDDLRGDLKEPWGPVFTDADALLAEAGGPLIAVGDVVTYHLEAAGREPDVSLVDEMTERSAVDEDVREALGEADVAVESPAAALTDDLLEALVEAIDSDGAVRIHVDGEEDLATLPAIVAAPDGASVVYGQPGEGMVLVSVTPETREAAESFLRRMDGDAEAALGLLG
ncbi:MAG TPA: GTP-dependent dephospho-CoA kinase family protein [Halobacteriales archaeon]|nr:GTP-dependent dephospho-CoA kinase family protein [Halobacteriales archaeon]